MPGSVYLRDGLRTSSRRSRRPRRNPHGSPHDNLRRIWRSLPGALRLLASATGAAGQLGPDPATARTRRQRFSCRPGRSSRRLHRHPGLGTGSPVEGRPAGPVPGPVRLGNGGQTDRSQPCPMSTTGRTSVTSNVARACIMDRAASGTCAM